MRVILLGAVGAASVLAWWQFGDLGFWVGFTLWVAVAWRLTLCEDGRGTETPVSGEAARLWDGGVGL